MRTRDWVQLIVGLTMVGGTALAIHLNVRVPWFDFLMWEGVMALGFIIAYLVAVLDEERARTAREERDRGQRMPEQ